MCAGDSISLRMAMSFCLSTDSVETFLQFVCLLCNMLRMIILIVILEAISFLFLLRAIFDIIMLTYPLAKGAILLA